MLRLSRVASNKERVQLCQSSFDATSIYQTKLVGFPGLLGTYVSLLFVFKRKSEDIAPWSRLAPEDLTLNPAISIFSVNNISLQLIEEKTKTNKKGPEMTN